MDIMNFFPTLIIYIFFKTQVGLHEYRWRKFHSDIETSERPNSRTKKL